MPADKLPSRKQRVLDYVVKPGGLSDRDHDRIHELAELGRASASIARAISKHPSTVYWYMVREGLVVAKQTDTPIVAMRNGRILRRFSREEDGFIYGLRLQGYGPRQIAEMVSERFGFERRPHSVTCRLAMLASIEEANLLEVA